MLSLGYAESLDYDLSAMVSVPLSESLSLAWSGLLQLEKVNKGRQLVWASALSALLDTEHVLVEAELFAGIDPFETEFEKNFGDGRKVAFGAGKLLTGLRLGAEKQYEPFLGYSNIRHDLEYVRYHSAEYLVGLNYRATTAVTIAGNLNLVSTNSRIDYEHLTWNDSSVEFSVGLRF